MWERWDAIRPDGTIDTEKAGTMLSFNHYAYGAVATWLYRSVAGLRAAAPGYRVIEIAPRPAPRGPAHRCPRLDRHAVWNGVRRLVDQRRHRSDGGRLAATRHGRTFTAPEGWRRTGEVDRLGSGDHHLFLHSVSQG